MPAERSAVHSPLVWALVIAILAVGCVLRGFRLGGKSLSMGEVASLDAVGKTVGQVAATPRAEPPLYPVALSLWAGGSTDATRVRLLSAVAGVATLLVFFALARVLLPGWAAAAATLLLALSASQVALAQEARAPALGTLFVTGAWWCLVQLIAGRRLARWPLWLGLAVANTLAVCTCTLGVLSVAAQLVAVVLVWGEVGRRLLVSWIVSALAPAAAFVIQAPTLAQGFGRLPTPALPVGRAVWPVFRSLAGGVDGLWGRDGSAVAVAGVALVALLAVAGLLALRRDRAVVAVGLAWLAVPLATIFFLPWWMASRLWDPSEAAFLAPAVALLAGAGLAAARGRARGMLGVVLAAAVGLSAASSVAYLRPAVEREPWRGAVAWFSERAEPGDSLIIARSRERAAFEHHYDGPLLVIRDAPGGSALGLRRTWILRWWTAVGSRCYVAEWWDRDESRLVESHSFDGLRGQIVFELRPPASEAPPPTPGTPAPSTASPTTAAPP